MSRFVVFFTFENKIMTYMSIIVPPSPNHLTSTINQEDGSYSFAAGSNHNFKLFGNETFLQSDGQFFINKYGTLKLTGNNI